MLPIFHHMIRIRQQEENNRKLKRERRLIRNRASPFDLTEERFVELFRLNKNATTELIENLRPHLRRSRYNDAISVEAKVFTALRFFATGCYQRSVGGDFQLGLSQTAVHRCIHEITVAIHEHLTGYYIQFPTTRRNINEVKQDFMNTFNFPGVVGVIDCMHVAILKPQEEEHNFVNRKGSAHDSFIWRQSNLRRFLLNEYNAGLRGTWLIGDSGYPLEPILMVPFVNAPEGSPESRFNDRHMAARNCVERYIGLLKMRFRCILNERTALYSPVFMGMVVTSCAVLHNICIEGNIGFVDAIDLPYEIDDYPQNEDHLGNLHNESQLIRRNILRNYFD